MSWCNRHISLLIVAGVLIADQASKFWIKLTMRIGDEIQVFSWFRIHFLENEGMAFGLSFGENFGKLLLSLIRIAAIVFLVWYLSKLNKERQSMQGQLAGMTAEEALSIRKKPSGIVLKTSLLVSLSLILAGAIGNVIDCAFYGMIFSESYFHVAELFPEGGGYAPFLHGHVVDMLYFPLFQGHYPDWMPWVGGREFLFFRPVFNLADSAITVGFLLFFFTQRSFWWPEKKKERKNGKSGSASTAA